MNWACPALGHFLWWPTEASDSLSRQRVFARVCAGTLSSQRLIMCGSVTTLERPFINVWTPLPPPLRCAAGMSCSLVLGHHFIHTNAPSIHTSHLSNHTPLPRVPRQPQAASMATRNTFISLPGPLCSEEIQSGGGLHDSQRVLHPGASKHSRSSSLVIKLKAKWLEKHVH